MRMLARATFATLLLTACTSGETQVQGDGGTGGPTGTAATGPTATAPTGPTAPTDGGNFTGAVSLDIPAAQNPTGASMYSCDGLEGTWTYEPGRLPVQGIEMTLEAAPFSMQGGDGTLVIEGSVTIPGVAGGAGFVDTIDLEIQGTGSAPTMTSTGVQVEASGALEGFPIDIAQFFPENASFPIVSGAAAC